MSDKKTASGQFFLCFDVWGLSISDSIAAWWKAPIGFLKAYAPGFLLRLRAMVWKRTAEIPHVQRV